MENDLERVARLWDQTSTDRQAQPVQGWLDSPIVLEKYVQPKITGSPHLNWLDGLMKRAGIPRGGHWLSLGCGAADHEIWAAKEGLFSSMLALDASPVSLEHGRQSAAAQGVTTIDFREVDFNRLDLPAGAYDVVLMGMSLHHVSQLGYVLSRVDRALKPNGFFVVNEFIGPRQFQFTNLQLGIVRELLDLLPTNLRQDLATGQTKTEYVRMPVEHWNVVDPSEAICSDQIVGEIEKRFRVVTRVDYGGTLLNLLLEHIAHNFNRSDAKDVSILQLLAKMEELLIRQGTLPSDFTVMVMRKSGRAARLLRRLQSRWETALGNRGEASMGMFSKARGAEASTAASVADFRQGAHSLEIDSGFYHWEGSFRWMGPQAEMKLRMTSKRLSVVLAAPVSAIRKRHADWATLDVKVRLEQVESGVAADLGSVSVGEDQPQQHFLETPNGWEPLGQLVRVSLACERVWVPAEDLEGSSDRRRLTVQVMQVGFEELAA